MSFCEVPKCGTETHAAGLCFKHYMRVRRHGSVTGGRNGDGRVKSSHPLWQVWKSLTRAARRRGGMDRRWNDFWAFIEDVGERPSEDHRLYRISDQCLYEKANVEWRPPIWEKSQRVANAEYQRAWRVKRPRQVQADSLKRNYGLTLAGYDAMFEEQRGLCGICGFGERNIDARSGKPFALSVDHDHDTGQNRGLLCTGCNTGIGCLGHDPARLTSALAYLERFPPSAVS